MFYASDLHTHEQGTHHLPDKTQSRQTPGLMARKDDITGKGPVAGNHVSHAHNKAKRRFELNVQKKRFFVPEENRWVTLKVSAKTLKTINKKGISAVLKDARAKGMAV
jgi:large subunit ribosomal protein L28